MSGIFSAIAQSWNGLDWAFVGLLAGVLLTIAAVWVILYLLAKSLEASE